MAAYDGVPSVMPDTTVPDNYIRVQDKISPAVRRFGASVADVGDVFTQASSDNAFNLYQQDVSKLLRGDPSNSSMGPDGKPIEDTGYLGLNGRSAMDARPSIEEQINKLHEKYLSDLKTNPVAQNLFDKAATPFKTQTLGQISSHADQQSKVWYTSVNQASEDNALARIAAAPSSKSAVAGGTADLINARVKQAQLLGAQPGDEVWNAAMAGGKRDALKARVLAIGATDPSTALKVLKANQADAGTSYDEIYNSLRARADEQDGNAAADAALAAATADDAATAQTSYANPAQPIYREATTTVPGGMTATGLARTVQIESGGKPDIDNASGHKGLGQFSDATWAAYGGGGDPHDPEASIVAIQRYAADNAKFLTPILGRPPTDAELYLAHQQGPGGAAKLFRNPDASAAALIGTKAVIQNGGTQGMTAREFVAMWAHRFNGTTPRDGALAPSVRASYQPPVAVAGTPAVPVAPEGPIVAQPGADVARAAPLSAPAAMPVPELAQTPKATAMQAVLDDPNLTPEARRIAITRVNQQYAAMQVAADATATQKKQINDATANQYMTRILTGDVAGLDQAIANDPNLEWNTKSTLTTALLAHADQSVTGATAFYGPGFWAAYQQVVAAPGDPSRIADMGDLLRRAGPGGDLTLAGVQKLGGIMTSAAKSVDGQAVQTTKAGLLNYAKSKLSFQQDTGPVQIRDPAGEALFNSRFIPRFEASYDAWEKSGKNPWEFLTQENVDKMVAGLRNPREMAMAQVMAQQTGVDIDQMTAPQAPAGVDDQGWKLLFNAAPKNPTTQAPLAPDKWQGIIETLLTDPSDATKAAFDRHFAASGITAASVLDLLTPPGGKLPKFERKAAAAPTDYPGPHPVINGVEDLGLALPVQ